MGSILAAVAVAAAMNGVSSDNGQLVHNNLGVP